MAKQHIMAGVHVTEKLLTSLPRSKYERERRGWGPTIPFKGIFHNDLNTSH
jgi:hypothetical protein